MYNKLFTSILDSSIWLESNATRIVWVTLLAAMDQDGFARFASVRNLANRAVVSNEDAAEAVRCLEGPDQHAPEQPHEGRRIERVEGGWMILNAAKYREMSTAIVARERNRVRVAEHRAKTKGVMACNGVYESVTKCAPSEAEPEPKADAEADSGAGPEGIASLPALAVAGLAGQDAAKRTTIPREPSDARGAADVPPLDETARKARQIVAAMSVIAKSPIARRNQGRARKAIAALVLAGRDPMPILDDISNRAYEAKEPGAYLLRALESEAAA